MSNAPLDQNSRTGMLGLLSTNGTTQTVVKATAATHRLNVDDNTTGTNHGGAAGAIDENGRVAMFAESSAHDGALIALYVDATGKLLINSH